MLLYMQRIKHRPGARPPPVQLLHQRADGEQDREAHDNLIPYPEYRNRGTPKAKTN